MKPEKKLDKNIKNSLEMNELNDDELEGVAGGALQPPVSRDAEMRGEQSRQAIKDIKNSIARYKTK